MHAKSGLRVVLKWEIFRPGSVITAVIQTGPALRFSLKHFFVFVMLITLAFPFVYHHFRVYRGSRGVTVSVMAKSVPYSGFRMLVAYDDEDGERPRAVFIEKNETEATFATLEPSFCAVAWSDSGTVIRVDGHAVILSDDLVAYFAESGQPTRKVILNREKYRSIKPGTLPKLPEVWDLCIETEGQN